MKFSTTSAYKFLHSKETQQSILDEFKIEQVGEGYSKDLKRQFESIKYESKQDKYNGDSLIESLFFNNDCKVYLFKKTALEMSEKINIKYERRFDYLAKVSDGNKLFIVNENKFFKFLKQGNLIFILFMEQQIKSGEKGWLSTLLHFDISKQYESGENLIHLQPYKNLFLQLLIFYAFAKYETISVEPGRRNGTNKSGKLVNDSNTQVTIIDSTWHKVIVRTDGFDVRGFFRLQACGKNFEDRELIWINPFRKHGYSRGIKRVNQMQEEMEIK